MITPKLLAKNSDFFQFLIEKTAICENLSAFKLKNAHFINTLSAPV